MARTRCSVGAGRASHEGLYNPLHSAPACVVARGAAGLCNVNRRVIRQAHERQPGLAVTVVRLPAKEAQLIAVLKEKPMALPELLAEPFVRRKIGRGYVRPILKCLLDEHVIAVTNGIFWVRQGNRTP